MGVRHVDGVTVMKNK